MWGRRNKANSCGTVTARCDVVVDLPQAFDSTCTLLFRLNILVSQQKIFELLGEYLHAFEIHGLEVRIEELESKFSKDLSETTFNEINDLKELKKRKNIN